MSIRACRPVCCTSLLPIDEPAPKSAVVMHINRHLLVSSCPSDVLQLHRGGLVHRLSGRTFSSFPEFHSPRMLGVEDFCLAWESMRRLLLCILGRTSCHRICRDEAPLRSQSGAASAFQVCEVIDRLPRPRPLLRNSTAPNVWWPGLEWTTSRIPRIDPVAHVCVVCSFWPLEGGDAPKEGGRAVAQRKWCSPSRRHLATDGQRHVSLGLGMCPDSPGAEVIEFKLEQGLQHVEGVTEHRLPFSTGARPSVMACCSVAAADRMVV